MRHALSQFALLVRDYDEALRYYCGQLGFSLIEVTVLTSEKPWVVVRHGSPSTGGANILLAKANKPEEIAAIGNQSGGRVFLFLETDDFARNYLYTDKPYIVFVLYKFHMRGSGERGYISFLRKFKDTDSRVALISDWIAKLDSSFELALRERNLRSSE